MKHTLQQWIKKPLAIKKITHHCRRLITVSRINLTFWHFAKKLLNNEWIASYSKEKNKKFNNYFWKDC